MRETPVKRADSTDDSCYYEHKAKPAPDDAFDYSFADWSNFYTPDLSDVFRQLMSGRHGAWQNKGWLS